MTMPLQRVLVVFKKSLYRLYVIEHRDASVRRALRERDPAVQRLADSHRAQQASLDHVVATLRRRGIAVTLRWRAALRRTRGYDLIIAVGGDGTLLDTAHRIIDGTTPLLGVNSDPKTSVGSLCAARADNLEQTLDAIASGQRSFQRLMRIRVRVDGQPVLGPCLNDVLFAHRSPAEMSRFELAAPVPEARTEELRPGTPGACWAQIRSSGLWICTATGSTAAMRSAAGRAMSHQSRRLQFRVREPDKSPGHTPLGLLSGFVAPGQALAIVNRMRSARLWGDGAHRCARIQYGQVILVDNLAAPLRLWR